MPTFHATATIDRPAAEVWAVVADYDRDPAWRKGVETMAPSTSGPAIPGTTTDEVLHLGGRTYRNHGEVTAVEPGHRLEWRTLEGADANGSRTVTPLAGQRCEVELVLEVRTHGFERLLQPVLAPMLRKGLHQDLARLKGLLETAPVPVP
ncbi:MAG: SRPBCC family protein [Actinomycetota bacterium]